MEEPVTVIRHLESNEEEDSLQAVNHHDPIKDLEELVDETHGSIVNGNEKEAPPAAGSNVDSDSYNCGYVQESISIDIQIPSDKVGLIIGKGGKTIKYFQEKCGARMNIIQRTTSSDEYDKILRIVGPLQYVEHGRQLVHELICNAKDFKPQMPETSESSTNLSTNPALRGRAKDSLSQWKTIRYPVPRLAVGLIIGKGGETIRRIRMETGAKVRFDPVGNNVKEYDQQPAIVSGKGDQIRRACEYIDGLVSLALRGSPNHRQGSAAKESKFLGDDGLSTDGRMEQDIGPDSMRTSTGANTLCELSEQVTASNRVYSSADIKGAVNQSEDGRSYVCATYPCLNESKQLTLECGQGDPNNPCPIYCCQHQHHLSSGTSIPIASFPVLNDQNSSRDAQTITQFPMNSPNFPNWLDYFQPERQQAQADAWEQQVKAEEQQLNHNGKRPCFNQECIDASRRGTLQAGAKSTSSTDGDSSKDNPRENITPSPSEQWSSVEFITDKLNGNEVSTALSDRSLNNEKHAKLVHMHQPMIIPSDENRPRDGIYPCQNPTCSQRTGNPGEPMPNFAVNNNCFYPVLSPSARIITFYYDVNSNSVVVLNQWQCA